MDKKTNIIYFVADQMRADSLHHLGCEASITPNLDAILKDGVSFENAYCQNPVCVPSRCSFMTGLYPHTTGHRTIHYLQNEGEPNFLRTMKNNGYEVIWVGRNDIIPGDRPQTEFCDVYFNGAEYRDTKDEVLDLEKMKPLMEKMAAQKAEKAKDVDTSVPGYYSHYHGKMTEEEAHKTKGGVMASDWGCVEHALRYIKERKSDKPFFLYLTIGFPHPPYQCEDPWYSSIDRNKIEPKRPSALDLDKPSMLHGIARNQNLAGGGWLDKNYAELKATYLAMVSRFDHQFGMLTDTLKEEGLYDDSNIFVFSDHGDYTGDYNIAEKVQNCFEDPITNVPLLFKPAKQFEVKPRITPALAELVDLTQTVCDITGIKTEYVQFGKSLLPVAAGSDTHKDAVFCEGGRIHGETWAMEMGHGPVSEYWPRLHEQCKEGPEHTKATMIRMGNLKYIKRLYEKDELYDLEKDPKELNNIIEDPSYTDKVTKMKLRMLTFYQETADIVPDRKDRRW